VDNTICIWDPVTGEHLRTLGKSSSVDKFSLGYRQFWKGIRALAVLPDGSLASGSADKTICLWNPVTGEHLRTLEQYSDVFVLAVLPDGSLASASNAGCGAYSIHIWNPVTGALLRTLSDFGKRIHTGNICALAVLPDGSLASGSEDETICLWNPVTGEHLRTLSSNKRISALAVLPDGSLASGSDWDSSIYVWHPMTGASRKIYDQYLSCSVNALVVLPNGSLASGSKDKICIWNPITGDYLRCLSGHTDGITALAVLPDGSLASGSQDNTIRVWEILGAASEIEQNPVKRPSCRLM
jgi:WD40 repeat protein